MKTNIRPHNVSEMAAAYRDHPDQFDDIDTDHLRIFKHLINAQFNDIFKRLIDIEFVDHEPYGDNPKIANVLVDFYAGILKIHTTGNDSKLWDKFHNLQFRAIHDFIHCAHGFEFNHADEVKAYQAQMEFSMGYGKQFPHLNWDVYNAILRSEIVYQSSFKEHFGAFHISQKIILTEF
jgi:hypothetical protein